MADNITKAELLGRVSDSSGVSKVDAEAVLEAFFETAAAAAYGNGQVSWPGFGSFKGVRRQARMARNPRTGAPVPVKAATVMKFTQSSALKQDLNGSKAPTVKKAAKKRPATKKATKKSTKKSAKKATKKSAKKATKKSPRKSAKKATKKSPRKTAKKSAKKSARGRKR